MTGRGQYTPDVTEGITRVQHLPHPKIVPRSHNHPRRACPRRGHSAYWDKTFSRALHDLGDLAASTEALARIRLLYDAEDRAKEQFEKQGPGADARPLSAIRLELRQELVVPRLEQLKASLESLQAAGGGPVRPKSPMGTAATYALNRWEALKVYVTDGDLGIDSNVAENALRRDAVCRQNWLFADSDNGGRTAAALFSLIAACQRHKVEPFAYLRDVLTRIAAHPVARLADLLSQNWKLADADTASPT